MRFAEGHAELKARKPGHRLPALTGGFAGGLRVNDCWGRRGVSVSLPIGHPGGAAQGHQPGALSRTQQPSRT